jgi:pimeloyl-ACP methyl ester carboxylesterase
MRYIHVPPATPPAKPLPAVVFIHGLLGYSFSWRHNLEFFARHRDVYAMDLLGIGYSDRPLPGTADFGMPATASRLLDFLRTLGHSQIDLVGTSHGGAIAMLAASQERSSPAPLIRRLVLADPANPFMTNARFRLAFFGSAFGRTILRALHTNSQTLHSTALGRMYADESRVTQETRDGYEVNLADMRSYQYALEIVRTFRGDMQQLREALPSIADIPTLLLWGSEDQVVSPQSGLQLRECFRNAQYTVIPDAGHLPYEEAPAEFNRIVLQFLES